MGQSTSTNSPTEDPSNKLSNPSLRSKSASTGTVPSQYAAQTDRKYNELKAQYDQLLKGQEILKHKNSDLQTENAKRAKMAADLLSNQSKNLATIKQLQSQIQNLTTQNLSIQSLNNTIATNEKLTQALKLDLANAQQTILSMTSIVDVNQKLPTVDETLLKYQSIRDQQHADTCTQLKQLIKAKYPTWQKYYIAQIIHKIMFDALISSYNAVKQYKNTLFRNVAHELNLTFAIKQFGKHKDEYENDEKTLGSDVEQYIEKETHRILGNMLGSYFKNNYEYILRKEAIMNVIMDDMIHKWKELGLDALSELELEYMQLYVCKCCEVIWVMLLQDVGVDNVLAFYPMEWEWGGKEKVVYMEEMHRRVLGSDRKCETVLYCVWPAISRGNDICGSNKIDVVVKDVFYSKVKEKKQAVVLHDNDAKVENDVIEECVSVFVSVENDAMVMTESDNVNIEVDEMDIVDNDDDNHDDEQKMDNEENDTIGIVNDNEENTVQEAHNNHGDDLLTDRDHVYR